MSRFLSHCSPYVRSLLRRRIFCIFLAFLLVFGSILVCPHIPAFEEKRFVEFTEDVFRGEVSANTLNLHYMIADCADYDLNKTAVTLGNASLSARKKSCAAAENYLKKLESFDCSKLSPKRRLTYDIFHDYLETELQGASFLLYDEPLSPTLGIQAQLPILLAEYTFRTKGDIEDYLCLLTQVPDYFSSVLSFEQDKVNAGLFMSRDCAREVISQCREFIKDPDSNYLIDIFNEKIDKITNLTADEKISYKSRNQTALSSYVIPAYEKLIRGVSDFSGSSTNSRGLFYYTEGTSYYQYLVKSTLGDNRSVEEIEETIKTNLVSDYTAIREITNQHSDLLLSRDSSSLTPEAMLDDLRQKITGDFPVLPGVTCRVRYVHQSLQNYLSPAFYLTPAIDDYQSNVIYINPGSHYSQLELYTTLAHEGYPGHLYQSVYFSSLEPDLLRNLLDTGGYTEGWATYVEMYSYSLWDGDPDFASLQQKNRSFTLGLASLLDIGIHYRGYTKEQVNAFLEKLGFGSDTAESLYQCILQSPANYLQYYVGYLNFCELRDSVKELQKEHFSLKEFHRMVLETGPAPFSILRRQVMEMAVS